MYDLYATDHPDPGDQTAGVFLRRFRAILDAHIYAAGRRDHGDHRIMWISKAEDTGRYSHAIEILEYRPVAAPPAPIGFDYAEATAWCQAQREKIRRRAPR